LGHTQPTVIQSYSRKDAFSLLFEFCRVWLQPYSPFTALAGTHFRLANRSNITQWDKEVIICDLNSTTEGIKHSDVGVFSGVIEYLNDPALPLRSLQSFHSYLLISYAAFENGSIEARCVRKRWENHFTLCDFIRILRHFGFIANVSM
jgi:hypothetical protein